MKKYIENIVLGKPIVSLDVLLGSYPGDKSFEDVTIYDDERFLPRLLSKHNIMSSISEVKRNRPDLIKELDSLDFIELKIGKKRICIVVGAKTEEEFQSYFE